jgi:hypothetical protein
MPASATPCTARSSSSSGQLVLAATTRPNNPVKSRDTARTRPRPYRSDNRETGRIASASASVDTDRERLACAGERSNARPSVGSSGCTTYSAANVATPAQKSAKSDRR